MLPSREEVPHEAAAVPSPLLLRLDPEREEDPAEEVVGEEAPVATVDREEPPPRLPVPGPPADEDREEARVDRVVPLRVGLAPPPAEGEEVEDVALGVQAVEAQGEEEVDPSLLPLPESPEDGPGRDFRPLVVLLPPEDPGEGPDPPSSPRGPGDGDQGREVQLARGERAGGEARGEREPRQEGGRGDQAGRTTPGSGRWDGVGSDLGDGGGRFQSDPGRAFLERLWEGVLRSPPLGVQRRPPWNGSSAESSPRGRCTSATGSARSATGSRCRSGTSAS